MRNYKEIQEASKEFEKIKEVEGYGSDHTTMAFLRIQAAKMGKSEPEGRTWATQKMNEINDEYIPKNKQQ